MTIAYTSLGNYEAGNPPIDITDPLYALSLGERMEGAILRQTVAARALIQWKQTAQIARELLKTIEAETVINGGFAGIVIDGRNSDIREAQLTTALIRQGNWIDAQAKLRAAEREAQEAEADIDTTTNEIRYCRLLLEFGTSLNNRLATPFATLTAMEADHDYRNRP